MREKRRKSNYQLALTGNRVCQLLVDVQSNFNAKYDREPGKYKSFAKAAAAYESLSVSEAVKILPLFRARLMYTQDDFGNGSINSFSGPPYTVNVGVGGLEQKLASDDLLSDLDFTRVVVAMQHEFWHLHDVSVEQMQSGSKLGARLTMSDVVAQFNQGFYMYNYGHNIREIRAERHGIEAACGFISDVAFDSGVVSSREAASEIADDCVLQYVNFRLRASDSYFVKSGDKRGFMKMSDVYDAFDAAERDSYSCGVVYPNSRRICGDVVPAMLNGGYDCFSKGLSGCTSYADREIAMAGVVMFAEYNVNYMQWKSMDAAPYRFKRAGGAYPVLDESSFESVFGYVPAVSRSDAHGGFIRAQQLCDENLEAYRKSFVNRVRGKAREVFSKPVECPFSLRGLELDLSTGNYDFQKD